MNVYTRSTRECAFADLGPELTLAIRKHIEKYKLGDVESALLICCETTSTNQKTGLFANGDETTIAGMFVTTKCCNTSFKKLKHNDRLFSLIQNKKRE
jgi:hypothetical protein